MFSGYRTHKNHSAALFLITALLAGTQIGSVPIVTAQGLDSAAPTFAQAQVDAGREVYTKSCVSCHGAALEGGIGRPLSGSVFQRNWADGSHTLRQLHYMLSHTMPPDAPGSLTESQYLSVIAFMLSKNGYTPGARALTDAGLDINLLPATVYSRDAGVSRARTSQNADAAALEAAKYPIAPATVEQATTSFPTDSDLLHPTPPNWLTYNRDLEGDRYSPLTQINVGNVERLVPKCIFQLGEVGSFQNSPVIYDGQMYVNAKYKTFALNAATCTQVWVNTYVPKDPEHEEAAGRGVAFYEGKLFRGTSDGHVIAIDAATGQLLWDARVTNAYLSFSISLAPVAFEGKLFVGESGADYGIKGRLFALDVNTGSVVWDFNLIPTGTEKGHDSWTTGAEHGGASVWSTVTIDPVSHLVLVPTGNPGPDYNGDARPGDNLFTDSVVALDITDGKLAWYVQQVPHDTHDWDTAAAPAIYDRGGRKYMAVASKEGHLYLYDRQTQSLIAKSETISPRLNTDVPLSYTNPVLSCPGGHGQWNGPAYSPKTGMLFVGTEYRCSLTQLAEVHYFPGQFFWGGGSPRTGAVGTTAGWLKGFDAETGKEIWSLKWPTPINSGMTATAGGVLFAGDRAGYFLGMDQKTGKVLYRFMTGGSLAGGISTYAVNGKQYVAVASGNVSRSTPGAFGAATVVVISLP